MKNVTLETVALSTIESNVTNRDDPDAYLVQVGRFILSMFHLQIMILKRNEYVNGDFK